MGPMTNMPRHRRWIRPCATRVRICLSDKRAARSASYVITRSGPASRNSSASLGALFPHTEPSRGCVRGKRPRRAPFPARSGGVELSAGKPPHAPLRAGAEEIRPPEGGRAQREATTAVICQEDDAADEA